MTQEPTETEQKSIELMQQKAASMANASMTTEERLEDIRAEMVDYTPRETFGREYGRISGWYYSEPVDSSRVERLTDGIVLGSRRV